MTKVAIVGDIHASDVAPESRKDDYRETILNKLVFIADTCNSEKIEAVVFLGDIFHRKDPKLNSHELNTKLIEVFQSFNADVYVVPGNHDISMTTKNLYKQPLKVIEQARAITLLGYPETETFVASYSDVDIYGLINKDSLDKFSQGYFDIEAEIKDISKHNLLCLHQMLLPDGEKFFGDFLNFAEIAQLNFGYFACGHYHPGYNPVVKSAHNKRFINPGAISRGSLDSHNLDKEPSFLISVFEKDTDAKFYRIIIPHEPAEKVFDLDKIAKAVVSKEEVFKFIAALKDVSEEEFDLSSVDGLLSLLLTLDVEKEIIDFIRPYLQTAQEEII